MRREVASRAVVILFGELNMKRWMSMLALACLLISMGAPAARAAVNVERNSAENPVVEISRSVIYGGLAGLVVGGAIALASESDNSGDIVRWCFVGGTLAGLAAGIYFVSSRPQPRAVIEVDGGALRLHAPQLGKSAAGGAQVPLVAVRF